MIYSLLHYLFLMFILHIFGNNKSNPNNIEDYYFKAVFYFSHAVLIKPECPKEK